MNRKKSEERWSEVLQVLLTKEMKQELVDLAKETGLSQSMLTRSLLEDAIKRERIRRQKREQRLKKMAEQIVMDDEQPRQGLKLLLQHEELTFQTVTPLKCFGCDLERIGTSGNELLAVTIG